MAASNSTPIYTTLTDVTCRLGAAAEMLPEPFGLVLYADSDWLAVFAKVRAVYRSYPRSEKPPSGGSSHCEPLI